VVENDIKNYYFIDVVTSRNILEIASNNSVSNLSPLSWQEYEDNLYITIVFALGSCDRASLI